MQHNSLNQDPGEKADSAASDSATLATQDNLIPEAIRVICDELGSSHDLSATRSTK